MKKLNINNAALTAFAAAALAKKEADLTYEETKDNLVQFVRDSLDALPEGEVILNSDIAEATALPPSQIANILFRRGHTKGIRSTGVNVTRNFIEVDESGAIVPNGHKMSITRSMCAFRKSDKYGR